MDYNEWVKHLAETKSSEVLLNHGDEQCITTLSMLFANSAQEVRIFCGCLDPEIYDKKDCSAEIISFLKDRKGKLLLMTENDPCDSELLRWLMEYKKEHPEQIISRFNVQPWIWLSSGEHIHFSLGDSYMYRLEKNPKKRFAEVCYNDEKKASELMEFFDRKLYSLTSQETA